MTKERRLKYSEAAKKAHARGKNFTADAKKRQKDGGRRGARKVSLPVYDKVTKTHFPSITAAVKAIPELKRGGIPTKHEVISGYVRRLEVGYHKPLNQ